MLAWISAPRAGVGRRIRAHPVRSGGRATPTTPRCPPAPSSGRAWHRPPPAVSPCRSDRRSGTSPAIAGSPRRRRRPGCAGTAPAGTRGPRRRRRARATTCRNESPPTIDTSMPARLRDDRRDRRRGSRSGRLDRRTPRRRASRRRRRAPRAPRGARRLLTRLIRRAVGGCRRRGRRRVRCPRRRRPTTSARAGRRRRRRTGCWSARPRCHRPAPS